MKNPMSFLPHVPGVGEDSGRRLTEAKVAPPDVVLRPVHHPLLCPPTEAGPAEAVVLQPHAETRDAALPRNRKADVPDEASAPEIILAIGASRIFWNASSACATLVVI